MRTPDTQPALEVRPIPGSITPPLRRFAHEPRGRAACLAWSVLLTMCMALTSGTVPMLAASSEQASGDNLRVKVDTRWLPWLGSWSLMSDSVNRARREIRGTLRLSFVLLDDGRGVTIAATLDGAVQLSETMVADGSRHAVAGGGCEGWRETSWSNNGLRLLFRGDSQCVGDTQREVWGLMMFASPEEWLDIQLVRTGGQRALTVRRYGPLPEVPSGVQDHLSAAGSNARIAAGLPLTVDEIIELAGKLPPEILEAALLESGRGFHINAKTLLRLADAKVPESIVDLMVALSFPDKFVIERETITEAKKVPTSPRQGGSWPTWRGFWDCGPIWAFDPWYPWYWTSLWYGRYFPWTFAGGWRWYSWPWSYGFPYYSYPYQAPAGDDGFGGGVLVAGRGYTRVYTRPGDPGRVRYAHARGSRGDPGGWSSSSTSSSGGSASTGSGSSGSSGGPSASPAGYSGGSSGGQAKPRE